ncbi:helix-turn-helix transcriptional regulator [Nocardiopsis sp. NPDC006139]|uniref:helix-turn-helix domain-containing protein n=1 Tax=Nocardiopsis sp. NPDC006139 TaxID=3154578 RepID=UPI0033A5EC0A
MSTDRGPVVHQRLLIRKLIELRHECGLTQEQVGKALDWSHAKVMRYEGGVHVLSQSLLDALLVLYGVAGTSLGRELRALGTAARKSAWWHPYRNLMKAAYRTYIGLEAGADTIRQTATTVVPGLLQTRSYSRCVTATYAKPLEVEPLVDVRMRRQSTLANRDPRPRQMYLLSEAVLSMHVGVSVDPDIMPGQLHHLVDMAGRPEVQIRVIPAGHGEHAAMIGGSFILLGFDDELGLDDVFYAEMRNMCSLTDKKSEMGKYLRDFQEAWEEKALPEDESVQLIKQHANSMKSQRQPPVHARHP